MLERLENVNFSQTQRFGPKYFFLQCIFILLDFLKVDLKKIFVVVFYTFSKVRKIRFFSHSPLFGHKPEILALYCLLQKRLLNRQNNANLSSWVQKVPKWATTICHTKLLLVSLRDTVGPFGGQKCAHWLYRQQDLEEKED